MEPKVSIIVPLFNAEKSLARCVDSILNQEFREFKLNRMYEETNATSRDSCDG